MKGICLYHKYLVLLLILTDMMVCTPAKSTPEADIPQVTVSILPQQYFVTRIAQKTVRINVMIPPGHNPHTYEPTPQQMKALGNSKIYFRIGHIPFEKAWMDRLKAANPTMVIADTSIGVNLIEEEHHHHEEGHHHSGVDPHIWLSPRAVKIQLNHILSGLCRLNPQKKEIYQRNFQEFITEIDRLDNTINSLFKGVSPRKILAYHPAWGYLARDYQLDQIAIEAEGKDPNPAQLKELIETARRDNIRVIIVQKQFDVHNAETIAREINGQVISLDPLALDWLNNIKTITQTLAASLKK